MKRILLAFAVLVLAACTAPTGSATPTPLPNYAGPGYLWYDKKPDTNIIIFSPVHQSISASADQLELWRTRGEVCVVTPGTRVGPSSVQHPADGWPVEVLEGPCTGFNGWTALSYWHDKRP